MTRAIIHAPFDPETVTRLRAWQECQWTHDLTCNGSIRGKAHQPAVMDVCADGLTCPTCGFRQLWVPECCLHLPANPVAFLMGEGGELTTLHGQEAPPRMPPLSSRARATLIFAGLSVALGCASLIALAL